MTDGSACTRNKRISTLVQAVLARRSKQSPLSLLCDLREAGLTSLDLVNLMLDIESEFDIEIPQAEMTAENFSSVEAIDHLVAVLNPAA
jgi:acyl carrier protein